MEHLTFAQIQEKFEDQIVEVPAYENIKIGWLLFVDTDLYEVLSIKKRQWRSFIVHDLYCYNVFTGSLETLKRNVKFYYTAPASVFYQLLDINEDKSVSLLASDNSLKEDLFLPQYKELADRIKQGFESNQNITIEVKNIMGKEVITSFKITDLE